MDAVQVERLSMLRQAIRDESGLDRNVMNGFEAFSVYNRNDLDLRVSFYAGKSIPSAIKKACFDLVKDNMKGVYERSGYGWYDDEKRSELNDPSARFLIVEDMKNEGRISAFVNFRFTLQGELIDSEEGEAVVIVYDIQVQPEYQGKGLGKHLMQTIELIASKYHMSQAMVPIVKGDPRAVAFFQAKLKGYGIFMEYGEDEHQCIFSKKLFKTKRNEEQEGKAKPNVLCSPSSVLVSAQAPPASSDEVAHTNSSDASGDDCADDILSQLMDLFKQQNGREATEAEVTQWMNTLREATEEGLRL